jgi:nicotinamide-nucleotide amidase
MKIEIITIGNEILCGLTMDSNFHWVAGFLNDNGFSVDYHTSVKDIPNDMIISFSNAKNRADIVIVTGGLGPTDDDLTARIAAEFFDVKLELNIQALEFIREKFRLRNRKLHKINQKPAYLPERSEIIVNEVGTAPGFSFKFKNTIYYFLPGVPREFKSMMRERVFPELVKFNNTLTRSVLIKTYGLKESEVAVKLGKLRLDENVYLGYRSHFPEIHLRISSSGDNMYRIKKTLYLNTEKIKGILNEYIFGYDENLIEEVVGHQLAKLNLTLSIAESCTGGLVSHRITNIPGSSKYFNMAVVCYSNESKLNDLSVPKSIIKKYGAVSSQVAKSMSIGIMKISGSDIGVGITGIAGPGGGTKDKPVGTVHIAVASKKLEVYSQKFTFYGNREHIKLITSTQALDMIRKLLLNYV